MTSGEITDRDARSSPPALEDIERLDAGLQLIRLRRFRYLIVVPLMLLGLFVVGSIALFYPALANTLMGVTVGAGLVAFVVLGIHCAWSKCPRCSRRFFIRDGFGNAFASKCLNCGLKLNEYKCGT
ncbi:MAG TPA: hypothetical protein P5572_01165 [Phycisphaerae bacterium]|nr:hypothetical protein [Phycisphaerae bacterium]